MSPKSAFRKSGSRKSSVAVFLAAAAFAFAALPAAAQSDIQWDRPASPASDPYRALPEARLFAPREVEALVAPIALFPDSLVAQILMAATYPYDVEDAADWIADPRNGRLVGYALSDALDDMDWDPSVKALTSAPDVLRMMNERPDWTANLGQAFMANQGMVMDAVQHLRREARANGGLYTDRYRRIFDRDGEIIIEPVSADEMYFQFYDPRTAYGRWAYDDYPPYFFPPVYYQVVRPIPIFGPLWGWSTWDWRGRNLHLDVNRWRALNHNRPSVIVGNTWRHDATRNRNIRGRADRTNFGTSPRTPDGRGAGRFRGRENDGRDNTPDRRNRGPQGRQPAAQPGPVANAVPAPDAPRGGFRGRGGQEPGAPRERGPHNGQQQTNREQPRAIQPAPGQPGTQPANGGRFNRGGMTRGEVNRGSGGESGRQRRQEANITPPAAAPGGRYRGDRPQAAAENLRGAMGPRGRFGGAPQNAGNPPRPGPAAQPAHQPKPGNGDNGVHRGHSRGDGPPNR